MKKIRILGVAVFLAAAQLMAGCGGRTLAELPSGKGAEEETLASKESEKEAEAAEEDREGKAASFEEALEDDSADGQVASEEEMAARTEVLEEGMTPISGEQVKDGTYEVAVDSSSSMFRVTHCSLTVKGGEMTAVMTMGGKGYLKLFMGTGREAVASSEQEYIPFMENENGEHTYEVPVEALDAEILCTAFSKNKEKWYDRSLVFRADSLPLDAFVDGAAQTPESLGLEDGRYMVEVTLGGGSGKAGVESPASLRIEGGQAYATIIFSSPNYDYMKIGEETYYPVNTEGNSAFEIPVSGFDWNMAVVADTIAMSEPHEISYTLKFASSTIKREE